jgi:hypothetical protein
MLRRSERLPSPVVKDRLRLATPEEHEALGLAGPRHLRAEVKRVEQHPHLDPRRRRVERPDHRRGHVRQLAVARRPRVALGLPQLDPPGEHDAAEQHRRRQRDVPADELLLLVVPDLGHVAHLAAAFGDAGVVQDQVNDLARARPHRRQERVGGLPDQARGVPLAVGEEPALGGAVPAAGRRRREVQQLGRPQAHDHRQDQAPQVRELRPVEQRPHRREELLHERRQAADNHGAALHGSGDSSSNHPA